jgi:hypothetical protein
LDISDRLIEAIMVETGSGPTNAIEVRVDTISQLFHTLDPYPFREKDLDREAEEFIVNWARELPAAAPLKIIVHLPESEAVTSAARDLGPALTRFFRDRSAIIALELNELFRVGRLSLAIGVCVLFACITASQIIGSSAPPPLRRVIEESLLIAGWVANWRPIQIFLYDWWPIVRRRNLYRRIAAAHVELRPYAEGRDQS